MGLICLGYLVCDVSCTTNAVQCMVNFGAFRYLSILIIYLFFIHMVQVSSQFSTKTVLHMEIHVHFSY